MPLEIDARHAEKDAERQWLLYTGNEGYVSAPNLLQAAQTCFKDGFRSGYEFAMCEVRKTSRLLSEAANELEPQKSPTQET